MNYMSETQVKCNSPIVMVGVLPPPVHGQSLATKALFGAEIEGVEQVVVEIRSSKKLDEVGKPSLVKMLGLFGIIYRVIKARMTSGAEVMYYTAGSAALVPFVRDIVLLGTLRPFFKRTLIHYHSGGLPDYFGKSKWKSVVASWVYGRDAWSLCLSKHTPVPGLAYGAAREIEMPNGLDIPDLKSLESSKEAEVFNILFVGNLYDDKGVFDLIEAVGIAAEKTQKKLRLSLVGKFPDKKTEKRCYEALEELKGKVLFDSPGPRYGDDKWVEFSKADIFAFPTYYRSENLPLVVIEAMGAGLPILSTNWRGLPSLVEEGSNGFLSAPRDVKKMAENIALLVNDADLCAAMQARSRELYLEKFTFARHIEAFGSCFKQAREGL